MLHSQTNSNFKSIQNTYIKKRNQYLKNKSGSIKPFKAKKQVDTVVVEAKSKKDYQDQTRDKLDSLAKKISTPLLQITTMSYIKIFPITLTLDLKKITIDETNFIKSHSIQTLAYENLKEVTVETGIYSSSLRLSLSGQMQHPIVLPHFRKSDAIRAKQIIVGLMNCQKAQIKPDDLDPERDVEKIRTIGASASP